MLHFNQYFFNINFDKKKEKMFKNLFSQNTLIIMLAALAALMVFSQISYQDEVTGRVKFGFKK